jgi:hypothetical protein
MHTRNVNVRTAAHESSRKIGGNPVMGLTYEQAADLFSWVVKERHLLQVMQTKMNMGDGNEA